MENPFAPMAHAFSDADRAAVYHAIFSRRDVRGQFLPDPVPDEVLSRVLMAAHHAPSVGFMQPWNFLLVRSAEVKQRVHDVFAEANGEAARMFPNEKREIYSRLKLQGIVEAPLNLCIGQVSHFKDKPELEQAGWLPRLPIDELLYFEQWGATDAGQNAPLIRALRTMQNEIQTHGIFPA